MLLDTHVALWAITDSPRLSRKDRDLLLNPRNNIWVSTASLWEIAIKHSLGRGDMPVSGEGGAGLFSASRLRHSSDRTRARSVAIEQLPPHHQDPFDRILVAQALTEPMRLLTHDEKVASYSSTIILI